MQAVGISKKNCYIDKKSGKDFNRPQYMKLLRRLNEGDVVFVLSIDRLGRNYEEIIHNFRGLFQGFLIVFHHCDPFCVFQV